MLLLSIYLCKIKRIEVDEKKSINRRTLLYRFRCIILFFYVGSCEFNIIQYQSNININTLLENEQNLMKSTFD